jgi:hypothetical protein
MFTYSQSTGLMAHNGLVISRGYSGNGGGLNNPAFENVPRVGPCPQGRYTIGHAQTEPKLGPVAMVLTPDPVNAMYGRSDFLIHGDNAALDHTASEGCLIFDLGTRVEISAAVNAGDNQLEVIE